MAFGYQQFLNKNKQAIVDSCVKDMLSSEQISSNVGIKNKHFIKESAHQFIDTLSISCNNSNLIHAINKKSLEPVLYLWHALLQLQTLFAFSSGDLAIFIYAFRTAIHKQPLSHIAPKDNIQPLLELLDILGILTLEVYNINQVDHQHAKLDNKKDVSSLDGLENFIYQSPAIRHVLSNIQLILNHDITIVLEGESGTGKDRIASIIQKNSLRRNKPFVTINCGAIPKDLIESELFGHERGAFTGADFQKKGKFERANHGTLFLDELSELPLEAQIKLLRVLQNNEIERIGGSEAIPIDVRIIVASNNSLETLVKQGKFRLDLYHRIYVFPIHIPSLKDRKEDIIPLAQFFIKKYSQKFGIALPQLSNSAERFLLHSSWGGNVRELENLIQKSLILSQGTVITEEILISKPGVPLLSLSLPESKNALPPAKTIEGHHKVIPLDTLEKKAIKHALSIKKGNIYQTSKALGISRTTLYNKIRKHNIDPL